MIREFYLYYSEKMKCETMKESLREQLKLRENTINKLKNELLATKVRENAKIKILKEDSNYCRGPAITP